MRTLREKSQTRKEEEVSKRAEDLITLSDFDSSLYISYAGNPLLPIDENWTSKQIVEELSKIRANYIRAQLL